VDESPSGDPAWKVLRSSGDVLVTPYYRVRLDHLRHPDGHDVDYYVVSHPRKAVGIVALDEAGRVLMVRQWRHPVGRLIWAVPAGSMEDGESPEAAARRELREETGHEVGPVRPLYVYHPNVGTSDQEFHLFIGESARRVCEPLPGEIESIAWRDRAQVEAMIANGELGDGLSLVALLLWLRRPEGTAAPRFFSV